MNKPMRKRGAPTPAEKATDTNIRMTISAKTRRPARQVYEKYRKAIAYLYETEEREIDMMVAASRKISAEQNK